MTKPKTIREALLDVELATRALYRAYHVMRELDKAACEKTRADISKASGTRPDGSQTSPYGAGNGPV